jgi:hypothetical protein
MLARKIKNRFSKMRAVQSIGSLFTASELANEKQWLEARDLLTGRNFVTQNVMRALELAAACPHKEALWLTGVFAGKIVLAGKDVKDVLLLEEKNLPSSLCLAALLSDPHDTVLLRRSAELGHPLAQALIVRVVSNGEEEKFRLANSSASQCERDGFFWLGYCCGHGFGCEKDLDTARECYLIAAQLGLVDAMRCLGLLLDGSDPQRWFWFGRAAVLRLPSPLLNSFSFQVQGFNSGSRNGDIVFQIGKVLSDQVSVQKRTIFGKDYKFGELIDPANSAIAACRLAVDAWSHVGIRCGVVKDIRVLIGKSVWESRDLALYKV